MSGFKNEVLVGDEWSTNSCVYATEEEAYHAGRELLSRWFIPTDHRAQACDDKPNYRFNFDKYRSEPLNHD